MEVARLNEAFGWAWILAGFLSGLVLGLFFRREDWLGGYASFPRRLVRLGHISFLGLGLVNILFALSAPRMHLAPATLSLASRAFVIGGVTMPLCCGLLAWKPGLLPLFAVPVLSLLAGAALAVAGLVRP
jgi:hypothetical protein